MSEKPITTWEEHQFWLKILEDHAHFVHDYLSPSEYHWVRAASAYIAAFARLREQLRQIPPDLPTESDAMAALSREIYPFASGYYQLEGQLQQLRICNAINVNLSPTYFNGTLDENQEYLRQLEWYMKGEEPPELPLVELFELWLEDQAGHALLLAGGMDPVEREIIEQARTFADRFSFYLLKNRQMRDYLRFTRPMFPAQQVFAQQVAQTVLAFTQLVMMVIDRYRDDEVLNKLTLRFLEHHLPEACYFLRKLAPYLPEDFALPDCQFSKPYFS
ncbi:DUF2935 domain-containing protein [Brevibacillus humidisoli]|uniref:DUF2935 domain-containing protein n=1 Tax=Brevibacillus humidisoli TaxID=2895522 RepID=UPI001E3DA5CC|nr:DUF2935 domain-containing protein [Brevibacillus humidisoli]UFJ40828.1 DUF2935 domain-containing protein [Brevibacillus humidisoli]